MNDRSGSESIVPVSRRSVLKAGAVTAVGAGLFSGTAAATNAQQINFCGCSQVCMDREGDKNKDGAFLVITAEMIGGEWYFDHEEFTGSQGDFCYDVEGTDKKIIGIRPKVWNEGDAGDPVFVYCNPTQCAQKALDVYLDLDEGENIPKNRPLACVNDGFGPSDDIKPPFDGVEIVRGRCGDAGKEDRSRGRGPK